MIDQPTAAGALEKLRPLVGQWWLVATPPGGEPWPGQARATFEWHSSGAHLVLTTTVDMPGAPDTIAITGRDAANGTSQWLSRARLGSQNTAAHAAARNPTATSSA